MSQIRTVLLRPGLSSTVLNFYWSEDDYQLIFIQNFTWIHTCKSRISLTFNQRKIRNNELRTEKKWLKHKYDDGFTDLIDCATACCCFNRERKEELSLSHTPRRLLRLWGCNHFFTEAETEAALFQAWAGLTVHNTSWLTEYFLALLLLLLSPLLRKSKIGVGVGSGVPAQPSSAALLSFLRYQVFCMRGPSDNAHENTRARKLKLAFLRFPHQSDFPHACILLWSWHELLVEKLPFLSLPLA